MKTGIRVVVRAGGPVLEIGGDSESARRELGAVAWSVLEAVALAGADESGVWSVATNARDLARRLGIGKDRAAAALGVLRRAGLVVAHTNRESTTSRFTASRYEVRLPVSRIEARSDPARGPTQRASSRARARSRDDSTAETLDLFSSSS